MFDAVVGVSGDLIEVGDLLEGAAAGDGAVDAVTGEVGFLVLIPGELDGLGGGGGIISDVGDRGTPDYRRERQEFFRPRNMDMVRI